MRYSAVVTVTAMFSESVEHMSPDAWSPCGIWSILKLLLTTIFKVYLKIKQTNKKDYLHYNCEGCGSDNCKRNVSSLMGMFRELTSEEQF